MQMLDKAMNAQVYEYMEELARMHLPEALLREAKALPAAYFDAKRNAEADQADPYGLRDL